jgi:hypothetical protein
VGEVEEGLERFTPVNAGRAWDILLWPYSISGQEYDWLAWWDRTERRNNES